jgi:hypothetical protein
MPRGRIKDVRSGDFRREPFAVDVERAGNKGLGERRVIAMFNRYGF